MLILTETTQLCSCITELYSLSIISILISIPISDFPFWPSFKEFQVSTAVSETISQGSLILYMRPTKSLRFQRCYQETLPPSFFVALYDHCNVIQHRTSQLCGSGIKYQSHRAKVKVWASLLPLGGSRGDSILFLPKAIYVPQLVAFSKHV